MLVFTFPVNLSTMDRKVVRNLANLTKLDILMLPNMVLTQRSLFSYIMTFFNPSGLISPLTIKQKIELRQLFGKEHVQSLQ